MSSFIMPPDISVHSSEETRKQLLDLLDEKPDSISLDCRLLSMVDSTGLGIIMSFISSVKRELPECSIQFDHVLPDINRLFKMVHLSNLHTITINEGA